MKLLTLLLITSCATYRYDANNHVVRRQLIESVKVGVKCPNNYYYSLKADMCYSQTVTGIDRDIQPTIKKPLKKAKKALKIDCPQLFKDINSCMGGK